MSVAEVFRRITAALDQAGIPYMLTGSFAAAYYGTPRATQDIDIVVAASSDQLRALVRLLPQGEYYVDLHAALEAHAHQSMFNVVDMGTGWKIGLIIRKSRPFSMAEFERRKQIKIQEVELFVASAEDVLPPNSNGRNWLNPRDRLKMPETSCDCPGSIWNGTTSADGSVI